MLKSTKNIINLLNAIYAVIANFLTPLSTIRDNVQLLKASTTEGAKTRELQLGKLSIRMVELEKSICSSIETANVKLTSMVSSGAMYVNTQGKGFMLENAKKIVFDSAYDRVKKILSMRFDIDNISVDTIRLRVDNIKKVNGKETNEEKEAINAAMLMLDKRKPGFIDSISKQSLVSLIIYSKTVSSGDSVLDYGMLSNLCAGAYLDIANYYRRTELSEKKSSAEMTSELKLVKKEIVD